MRANLERIRKGEIEEWLIESRKNTDAQSVETPYQLAQ
jgi:hypothetical protein